MKEKKLDLSGLFYIGQQTIYHMKEGKEAVAEELSHSKPLFPKLSRKPLISTVQKLSQDPGVKERGTNQVSSRLSGNNHGGNLMKNKHFMFGSLGGKEFSTQFGNSVDLFIENSKCADSTNKNKGHHLPQTKRLAAHMAVVATDKIQDDYHQEQEELMSLLMTADKPTDQTDKVKGWTDELSLPALSNYDRRKEYGKNMEKNWIKQMQEEKKKKKEAARVKTEEKMNLKQIDDLFRSLYSSGSEDEELFLQPITVDFGTAGSDRVETDQHGELLRYASMDELMSGSDQECPSGESDVEFHLQEGELYQRKVKHKMRKRRQRDYIKYLALLSEPESDSEEAEMKLEDFEGLTDTELRAYRLKLRKKEEEIQDVIPEMSIEDLKEMTRSALARIKPKHKKKKKSKKQLQREFEAEQAKMREMVKQKFMSDYEKLISDMNSKRFRRFSVDLTCVEPGFATKFFLLEFEQDMALLKVLPGCFSGMFNMFSNLTQQNNKSMFCFQDLQHIYQTNGEFVIRPHPLVTRRRSDPGVNRPKVIRYKKDFPCLQPVEINVTMQSMNNRRHSINSESDYSDEICTSQENSRPNSERPINHGNIDVKSNQEHDKVEPKSLESENIHGAKNNSVAKEAEEVVINTNIIRRTKSARNLKFSEGEIGLYELLEGINFPAKDIKIQIALRKMKRQSEKTLKRERFGSHSISDTTENTSIDLDTISEPEIVEQKEDTARTRRKFITGWGLSNYGGNVPYTKEELDTEIPRLGELFMEMKDCRYIRWKRKDQAIVNRIFELETDNLLYDDDI